MFLWTAKPFVGSMKATALVAWNLRRLRVKCAISQEALAVDAGVDRSYVGRIERGVENPTVETLDRLAGALDVAVSEMLTVPKQGEKPPSTLRKGRKKK
ncbi:helix-turn-helix transcriptional regulator [[Pseudomonas] carboxydohydrogena]